MKIHSSGNLASTAKQYRDQTLAQNPGIVERSITSGGDLDQPFTLFEFKRAISNTRQTTPGKDGICYCMLGHMNDVTLEKILRLFNMIWNAGKLPLIWKQAVIIPIFKPGKDPSNPSSYRPIALTSQLGKTMERTVTNRFDYYIEENGLISLSRKPLKPDRSNCSFIYRVQIIVHTGAKTENCKQ